MPNSHQIYKNLRKFTPVFEEFTKISVIYSVNCSGPPHPPPPICYRLGGGGCPSPPSSTCRGKGRAAEKRHPGFHGATPHKGKHQSERASTQHLVTLQLSEMTVIFWGGGRVPKWLLSRRGVQLVPQGRCTSTAKTALRTCLPLPPHPLHLLHRCTMRYGRFKGNPSKRLPRHLLPAPHPTPEHIQSTAGSTSSSITAFLLTASLELSTSCAPATRS